MLCQMTKSPYFLFTGNYNWMLTWFCIFSGEMENDPLTVDQICLYEVSGFKQQTLNQILLLIWEFLFLPLSVYFRIFIVKCH